MSLLWLVGNEGIHYMGIPADYIPLFPTNPQEVDSVIRIGTYRPGDDGDELV